MLVAAVCQVLHGDIAQNQREVTLQGFREGRFTCLVATDVAARGLDIPDVDLVIQTQAPKDKETYIHRSGRTGRAGRSGVCVTFFTKRDVREGSLKWLESMVGTKFELIGTPQQPDLIRVASEVAEEKLEHVHDEMIKAFLGSAERLIQEKGENVALAAALAVISGYTQPLQKRSLLTSTEGYTTVLIKNSQPIRGVGWIFMIIKRFLGEAVEKQVRDIELCQGTQSALPPFTHRRRYDVKTKYHFGLIPNLMLLSSTLISTILSHRPIHHRHRPQLTISPIRRACRSLRAAAGSRGQAC